MALAIHQGGIHSSFHHDWISEKLAIGNPRNRSGISLLSRA
jgi:hypothetical protein